MKETKWTTLEKQAAELGNYFSLVWLPQSGNCGDGKSMGYNPLYYWNQNSSFGTEAELRSLIKTFKANGIGTIADVVVNHRGTMTNWVDFPAETYNGVTYQMLPTDICADDDGGETKNWRWSNGQTSMACCVPCLFAVVSLLPVSWLRRSLPSIMASARQPRR